MGGLSCLPLLPPHTHIPNLLEIRANLAKREGGEGERGGCGNNESLSFVIAVVSQGSLEGVFFNNNTIE